ncbi:hypothetical protein CMO90_01060 [Candidatus Woesearchaeota archaeon]|jgi:hypothetical protein|nr:hypothetical protein [Candidatus Woesearchaeota archaeon]
MTENIPRPNLEEIAKKTANMEKNHKIDQIMPSVMDSFLNAEGVKHEIDGVTHYKTDFSEKEAEKLADNVYDSLIHHSFQRVYGMNNEKFAELKNIKDSHGNSMTDNHGTVHYNLRRDSLRKVFKKNRKNLRHEMVAKILQEPVEHHTNYHLSNIIKDLDDKHVKHIKDFVDYNVKEHKLSKNEYNVSEAITLKEVLPSFTKIAEQHYKHFKAPEKE